MIMKQFKCSKSNAKSSKSMSKTLSQNFGANKAKTREIHGQNNRGVVRYDTLAHGKTKRAHDPHCINEGGYDPRPPTTPLVERSKLMTPRVFCDPLTFSHFEWVLQTLK